MNELQEKLNALTSDREARYFYHITKELGDKILEEGLIVASGYWEESFLEFTPDELADIEKVLDENKKTKIKDNHTMIIAGVYMEPNCKESFIRKLNDIECYEMDWEGVGTPDYIVDSEHLIGYIDMDNLELIVNDRANVCGDYLDL